jgi:uncharacterized cupin superfamily protein
MSVPMAIVISQPASIPGDKLDQLGPVQKPLSTPASRLIGRKYIDEADGIDCMGIWECSPGIWERTIMQEEFAHFISGSATFIPEDGEPIELKAGDTIWFPKNSRGVWKITENVRKVYVVIDRPGVFKQIRAWLRDLLKIRPSEPAALPIVTTPVGATLNRASGSGTP